MAVVASCLSGATGSELASPSAQLLAAVWLLSMLEAMVRWLMCHAHVVVSQVVEEGGLLADYSVIEGEDQTRRVDFFSVG